MIIVNKQLIAGAPGNVTNQSDVGLVTKQASVLDEETGEEQIQITMLTADGEQEFVVSNLIAARDSFLQLTAGGFDCIFSRYL